MRPPPLAFLCFAAALFSALPDGLLPPAVVALAPLTLPAPLVLAAEEPAPLGPLQRRISKQCTYSGTVSTVPHHQAKENYGSVLFCTSFCG